MKFHLDAITPNIEYVCNKIQDEKTRCRCKSGVYAVAAAVYGMVSLHLVLNVSPASRTNIINISYTLSVVATGAMVVKYVLLSNMFYNIATRLPPPVDHQVTVISIR